MVMESQIERMRAMWGKIFVLSLLLIFLGEQLVFSKKDDVDNTATEEVMEVDNKSSNQWLMYRMLNYKTKNPADIDYYRRWRKERHLEWLKLEWFADHKNLDIPGIVDIGNRSSSFVPGMIDAEEKIY